MRWTSKKAYLDLRQSGQINSRQKATTIRQIGEPFFAWFAESNHWDNDQARIVNRLDYGRVHVFVEALQGRS